jgi:pimeloyl-ACP methyl ester carboxylesterase
VSEKALALDDWRLFRDWTRHHPQVDHWIADLSREGALTAALNWYRANIFSMKPSDQLRIQVPTLGLWSDGDAFLVEEQMSTAGRYVEADWQFERIAGASHWMMLDRPQHLNRLLLNSSAAFDWAEGPIRTRSARATRSGRSCAPRSSRRSGSTRSASQECSSRSTSPFRA